MPHSKSIIEKVHVPMILDEVMQIGGTFTPVKRFNQIFLGEPVEKTKCLINSARVSIF